MTDHDDISWMFEDDTPALNDDRLFETAAQLDRPKLHYRREARRAFVTGLKREALNELIPALPPPDCDLYIVSNGAGAEIKGGINPLAFDFGSFLPVVVGYMGNINCTCYVSTWTMNRYHAENMLVMLDDKRLKALTVCSDPYFARREPGIFTTLANGLTTRGQRLLCWKNHVKCIAIEAPDGRTCVITGSPNMSAQPRCEAYVLTTAPEVYQFFRDEFFEAMIAIEEARHAGH